MSTNVVQERTEKEQRFSSLDEVAETIRDEAIAYAFDKINMSPHGELTEDLFGQPEFFEYFKYGVADGMARVLAAKDAHVQAAYVYGVSTDADLTEGESPAPSPIIHMLVLVDKPSAALNSLITSLDAALVESFHEVTQVISAQVASIADIKLVTEEDVKRGEGYAVLIKSIFVPPIKIWSRQS